jgi:RNA polymerase sigma factor (sigma-70 family)
MWSRRLEDDPVTVWIDELRQADGCAADNLWRHFVQRLYELARKRLNPDTRRVYDEEDAVQSAFHSVCSGIAAGRFPDLQDREGLWRLLLRVTARKVSQRHRFDHRQRRNVARTLNDSIFANSADSVAVSGLNDIPAREPSPEFAAQFVEVCGLFFQSLSDPSLQAVARLRMDGYTDSEIGQRLNCTRRTVQRRVEAIRRRWEALEIPLH